MGCTILVGGQWGDEGKGKIISSLALKDSPSAIARAGVKYFPVAGLVCALSACAIFEEQIVLTAEGCKKLKVEIGRQGTEAKPPGYKPI